MMRCKRVTYRPAVRAWWRRKPLGHFSWRYVRLFKLFIHRKDWYWDCMTRIFLFSSSEPCPVTIWQTFVQHTVHIIVFHLCSLPVPQGPGWLLFRCEPRGPCCVCVWERHRLSGLYPGRADDLQRLQHPSCGWSQRVCAQPAAQKPWWVTRWEGPQ